MRGAAKALLVDLLRGNGVGGIGLHREDGGGPAGAAGDGIAESWVDRDAVRLEQTIDLRVGEQAQHMVERAVLEHEYDDMLDVRAGSGRETSLFWHWRALQPGSPVHSVSST